MINFFYLSLFYFFLSEQYLNLYYYLFDQNKWEKFAVWNLRLFYEGVKVLKERELWRKGIIFYRIIVKVTSLWTILHQDKHIDLRKISWTKKKNRKKRVYILNWVGVYLNDEIVWVPWNIRGNVDWQCLSDVRDHVPALIDKNFNFITVQNVYMVFANTSLYSSESVGNVICSKSDNTFTNNRPEELL